MTRAWRSVVALSGGVGGARLMHGLSRVLDADAVTMIVNTGDDFEHWGLAISPDLDTVMYTLADLAPPPPSRQRPLCPLGVVLHGTMAIQAGRRYQGHPRMERDACRRQQVVARTGRRR